MLAHPLRLRGLGASPPLVLMARLLALAILLTRYSEPLLVLPALAVLFTKYPRIAAAVTSFALIARQEIRVGVLLLFITFRSDTHYWAADPFPRLRLAVIWIIVLYAAGLILVFGDPITLTTVLLLTMPAFFTRWPEEKIIAIWDGSCGFCRRTKEFAQRFDFDELFDWVPQQTGIGDRFGITRAELRDAMYAVGPGWIRRGYLAFRQMVQYTALFWMAALAALLLAPNPTARRIVAGLLLAFLTPLLNPVGNAVYAWVARHRHELLAGETCELP